MLSSSSRVRLKQGALKEAVRLEPLSRRRRASELTASITVPPSQRVAEAGCAQRGNKAGHSVLTEQVGPEKVTHAAGNAPKDEDPQKIKTRKRYESLRDVKEEGPYTRDNRSSQPSLSGPAGSQGTLRRAVGAYRCSFCGDCKCVLPQRRASGKRGQKSIGSGLDQSASESKSRTEKLFTKASKNVIWRKSSPKVTLCDLARYCDACGHKCGFLLTDILKTKVVHCFKQDVKAGFCLRPGCLAQDKCKSEECASAKNSKFVFGARSEDNVCLTLNKHEHKIREWPDVETHLFPKGWATEAMATTGGKYRTRMRDENREEENPGAEMHRDKRMRLGDAINRGLPVTPGLTNLNYNNTTINCSLGKEQLDCWMPGHSQPSLKLTSDSSCSLGSAVTEKRVHKQPGSEPPETERQMLSQLFCEGSEVNADDDPESFTCQRVRAYIRKIKFSCARTYMPWPFSNSGHPPTVNASGTTCETDSCPIKSGPLSSQTNATESSLDGPNQASKEKQEDNGECTLNQRNGKIYGCTFSCSPDTTQAEQPLHCQASDAAGLSTPSRCGSECHTATFSTPSTPVNAPETNSSVATPSPSAITLSRWDLLSPFAQGGFNSLSTTHSSFLLKKGTGVEFADAHSTSCSPFLPQFMLNPLEKLQLFPTSSHFESLLSYSDSSHSCESSLILPQEEQEVDGNVFSDGSPSELQPYFGTSPVNYEYSASIDHCLEANSEEFMILPLLSPISSPKRYLQRSPLSQSQGCAHEEEVNTDLSKYEMLPNNHIPAVGGDSPQTCDEDLDHQQDGECCNEELEKITSECPPLAPSSLGDVNNNNKEKIQGEIDYEDYLEHGSSSSEQDPLDPGVKETPTSTVLTEPQSSLSREVDDEDDINNEGQPTCAAVTLSSLSEKAGHEDSPVEAAGDSQPAVLDEFTAYEQDILLVDTIQHDSELFENLPEQSLLKLGPVRVNKVAKTRPAGLRRLSEHRASVGEQKFSSVCVNFHWDSSEITEEQESRPWRPQSTKTPHVCPATDKETRNMRQPDANHNRSGVERSPSIQTVKSSHDAASLTVRNGSSFINLAESRRQKSNAYCRKYFSESLSCGFKMCRFQHVPVDGDEKFCVETVIRFTKNPMCIQKAGAVFTGYYQNNLPGVYFSMPVLLSLLWALLKAGMVSDVFPVLSVSLAHRLVPSYEFLLALFTCVRDKGLTDLMPELMQIMSKMASAGLVLSEHTVHPASPASAINSSEPFPEDISLAQSVLEIELCAKQEDWRRMGEVFSSICKFNQPPSKVEQISGRIAVALLSESKDKLSLPFAAFADTVCQSEGDDELMKSFLGRIGVSLMLRYHKTHQWAKGRKVVEVLSTSKVNYSTLKGLFGNEDGASRCCIITKAAELLLLSGSVEGALNTLRENKWFLSSSSWPCEPADLESRTRVLMRLAEKTSQRDTLEVLSNLPGMKEPNGTIDICTYSPLFNSHLQVCVDRQILPVASDTIDFMLSKKLHVEHSLLQMVLHKLGNQKLWLRAREVFRHCLSVGYYQGVSAPTGFMSLMVPCCLGEVELALTFEMFIAVNATAILHLSDSSTSSLSITLKRTQSSESEYLSAGSRLLSAACIPQPNLTVQYTTVNASQEQVFTLDICSARRWLRYNHLWANEVWMQ